MVKAILKLFKLRTTAWAAVSSSSASTVYSFLHLNGVGRALWANSGAVVKVWEIVLKQALGYFVVFLIYAIFWVIIGMNQVDK